MRGNFVNGDTSLFWAHKQKVLHQVDFSPNGEMNESLVIDKCHAMASHTHRNSTKEVEREKKIEKRFDKFRQRLDFGRTHV